MSLNRPSRWRAVADSAENAAYSCGAVADLHRLPEHSSLGLRIARGTGLPCENWGVERYAAVIHEDPEGGYWAEVPALPGCYSQGETIDELMENIREAITGMLEVMKEQGKRPEANIQILDVAVKPITRPEMCRLLETKGWVLQCIKGSHHVYAKSGERKIISIPVRGN
jgi:predicted RNase H-like HicB family nuclease